MDNFLGAAENFSKDTGGIRSVNSIRRLLNIGRRKYGQQEPIRRFEVRFVPNMPEKEKPKKNKNKNTNNKKS